MLFNRQFISRFYIIVACCLYLTGCTSAEVVLNLAKQARKTIVNSDVEQDSKIENQNDGTENSVVARPHYKIGDPYEIRGNWYYPERNLTYDETGIASWYGDEFAGRLTANGEIFDPELVTAAHKTLPMPSVVRVTNLETGKSLVVRMNDRGPYVAGRIIDLSREAARRLGFMNKGVARVRVQILAEQSLAMERDAKNNKFPLYVSNSEMPPVVADNVPEVNFDAKTTRKIDSKGSNRISAIDLLEQSRIGEIIEVPVINTKIWVQIGAFFNKESAKTVLDNFKKMDGVIAESLHNGKPVYKARLGPILSVSDADIILDDALNFGFEGAHIVVD